MAINIKFDTAGNPEPPSIILATKNGNKLGLLNVNTDSIELNDKLKVSEISFTLNKYVDGKLNNLWDKVVDFKLVWCKEWDVWFEIKVELDEATETVKTVFGTQLGQAELSQIMVYNMEVNTEEDIARDDYKITILCDENDHEASLLHRILKDKAPHYSIAYVDPTIARIQRQFSWDGSSICDVLDEIEEEIGCLVVYNSNSTEGGIPNRSISVYDLEQNCNDCGYRGEFADECPKCGSKNVKYGYGEDTTIFVTNDELATEGIQLVVDVDSVKNCFKLEAGDDLMTATIRNCNPNGSDYIWRFSDDVKDDMSNKLVEKLENYDAEYKRYYNEHESNLDATLLTKYNNLVEKYDDFYNTDSTCLNCDNKGKFYDKCSSCDSENLLTGKELQKISTPIVGYPSLMNAYYNTIDFALYLESGLMPSITMSDTTAEEQASLLTTSSLSPVAVNVREVNSISSTTADSAVLSMAKIIVKSTYKVEILSSSLSTEKKWSGTFKITNYSDDEDTIEIVVNDIVVNNDAETFIKQKIEKALNKENTDDYSISGLFEKEYSEFCTELTKYALKPLQSFYDAADACISILTEQGAGDETNKPDLYENLYLPYFQKQEAIASEINIRKNELAIIEGVYDETTQTASGGLQNNIRNCQSVIQDALNFEDYLGEDLWKEFCSFRREDKYSNSNYISDGLNNAQLFERALEFLDVAENEIYKSSELQHSISTSLNNLLAIDKFKPLVKYFKNGNWIRVRVDGKIYKLRLLEYDINFGSFESIPVEFSDVTKIKNSTTDVKDVIEQASAVASSYDAVTRQAKKGNVAKGTIEQWIDEGLNAANVQIQSNDSEEILITKSGLLGRSYDDITGTYSPEQLKITHNLIVYTDDDWETVSSALGKHNYKKWSDSSFVDDEGYGLTSKFVTAGYITGSQIIGGEILSSNYQMGESGTYLNLIKGDFDFAGGKIVYNADKNRVTLSGVEIQWDSVNTPTIENIDGLSGVTEDIRIIEQGLSATTINGQYVISPHIVGGDLKIVGNNGTSAQISNTGVLTATGANITGDITATSLTLGNGVKISTDNIDGIDEYAKVGDIEGVPDNIITTDNVSISTATSSNGVTTQSITVGKDDDAKTYTSIVAGDFLLTNIGIGTESPSEDDVADAGYTSGYFAVSKQGLLQANNAIIWGTIYATDGKFSGDIEADSLTLRQDIKLGNETDGYHTWISKDGTLSTENANISGAINAAEGSIGGFAIKTTETNEDGDKSGGWLYSGEFIGSDKSIFLSATDMSGTVSNTEATNWRVTVGSNFGIIEDGTTYMSNCEITGGSLRIGSENSGYHTWISEYGLLNAEGANINGTITAANGDIGGWQIIADALYKNTSGISSGMCSMQTKEVSSEGLSYALNFDENSYTVISIGSCVDTNVIIPSIYNDKPVTSIGFNAFTDCSSLEAIEIPSSVTSIDSHAFYNCYKLQTVTFSENSQLQSIGDYAFSNCSKLATVIFGKNSQLQSIGEEAFSSCESLTSIEIPSSVTSIGSYAFAGCESLIRVYYAGSQDDWDEIAINLGNTYLENATRYYSSSEITNNCISLVNNGNTSPPRFFAGSVFDIPTYVDDAKFLVLEDGSLYAGAAKLGTGALGSDDSIFLSTTDMNGTEGFFDGTNITNWRMTVGSKFGVTSDGRLYANDGLFKGEFMIDTKDKNYVSIEHKHPGVAIVQDNNLSELFGYDYPRYPILRLMGSNIIFSYAASYDDACNNKDVNQTNYMLYTGEAVHTIGTWNEGEIATTSSDASLKHDIELLDNRYDVFFDHLISRRFKYNDGTSDRYHFGYIAQEVKSALQSSAISEKECAAICTYYSGSEEEFSALRYPEFISLNTWQIQKLKKRVAELEERLKILENK